MEIPKKIIIIARHGARYPIVNSDIFHEFPNIHKKNDEETNLTKKGIKMCKKFGSIIYNKYFNEQLSIKDILIYSSDCSRTIESAYYFVKGLNCYEFKYDDIIIDDILGHNSKKDKLFNKYNNKIVLDDDLSDIRYFIEDNYGFKIDKPNNYFSLHSTIKCYEYENINLKDIINDEFQKFIENKTSEFFKKLCSYDDYVNEFYRPIDDFINELKKEDCKLIYLSTHDSILVPLVYRIFGEIKIPDFSSYIIYEIYENKVNIKYDNEFF